MFCQALLVKSKNIIININYKIFFNYVNSKIIKISLFLAIWSKTWQNISYSYNEYAYYILIIYYVD